MDCSPPGSSVHGILQARILERVAISFFRGSSRLRHWVSCIAGRFFTDWAARGARSGMASKKDRVNHLKATDQEQSGALCSGTIACPCPHWAPTLASLDSLLLPLGPKVPLLARGRVQTQREQNQLESDPQGFYFGALGPNPNPVGWTATEHERSPSSQLAKALAPSPAPPLT